MSKSMFFKLKRRHGRPQGATGTHCDSFWVSFGEAPFFSIFWPPVPEGKNRQSLEHWASKGKSPGWGNGRFLLAYARVNGTSSRGPLR